jgi:outer membrane protein OmpA-like peptidoglycan-associated protein
VKSLGVLLLALPLAAQTRLAPDAPNCADSKSLPKLVMCRIDNCESKTGDHLDVPVRDDGQGGEPVTTGIDGDTRAVMYECAETTTPADIVRHASIVLRASGFDLPYTFADKEGSITARKGDQWLTVEAASHYYTVTEISAAPPDEDAIVDAPSIEDALENSGKIPLYGITFLAGRADIAPESVITLREVFTMLQDNPDWRIRVEGHTDSTGTKAANQALSLKRAQAVVDYLVNRGVKRARLEAVGKGDSDPLASNDTAAGRKRNRRIQLVKLEQK